MYLQVIMKEPILSLCIATNGISEWVLPVLDSIYRQQVDLDKYEVVITDNGHNIVFKDEIKLYIKKYSNLVYKQTSTTMFQNEIDAFRLAKGKLIKFINHRMVLHEDAVQHFIDIAERYSEEQPDIYFSNGVLPVKDIEEYGSFNEYVGKMLHYSSWSAGLTMWKKDLENIPIGVKCDELFPHITLLFWNKYKNKYVIDNRKYGQEIENDSTKKGKYNLFYAFGVHYMGIIFKMLEMKSITNDTYIKIKDANEKFLVHLYFDFVLMKTPCSYILENCEENLSIFYNYRRIKRKSKIFFLKKIAYKVKRLPKR